MKLIDSIQKWLLPNTSIPRGNYHGTVFTEKDQPYKLFLMVDGQGLGTLVINASTVVNLNQTSTDLIYHYIRNTNIEDTIRFMRRKYKQTQETLSKDYTELIKQIESFLEVNDQSPRTNLDAFEQKLGDVVDNKVAWFFLNEFDNNFVADGEFWKIKINEAIKDGFPHIILLGGAVFKQPWIEAFVRHTEDAGIVAGIIAEVEEDDQPILETLIRVGLDHLCVLIKNERAINSLVLSWLIKQDLYLEAHLKPESHTSNFETMVNSLERFSFNNLTIDESVFMESGNKESQFADRIKSSLIKRNYEPPIQEIPSEESGWIRSEHGNVFLADGSRWTRAFTN